MAVSSQQTPQGPDFPKWPFDCLSLYTQMARDFSRYAQDMTRCTDAMEAAHVEADFGARMFADLWKGYFDLALAPWTAMAAAMAERAEQAPAAPPAARSRSQAH